MLASLPLFLMSPARAGSPAKPDTAAEFANLSLEQLANIEVTSVSRRAEPLADAAASIHVITAEDIRRSGAQTLPEALRLAPNLEVARADANQYAISARGFNNVLANKLLVLIDGRTVYSPLFSGVFWEAQDLPLDEIERIEVISGPGGTLWGTNAVNGVINIITRSARDTHGLLVSASKGQQLELASGRYGGQLGSSVHFRLFGQAAEQDHSDLASGPAIRDGSQRWNGGFRVDGGDSLDAFSLYGGITDAHIEQTPDQRIVSGGHLEGRWSLRSAGGVNTRLQLYYDRENRNQPGSIIEKLDTWDADFQQDVRIAGRHNVVWGAGYRWQPDDVTNLNPAALALMPADRDLTFAHAFLEDGITLHRRLELTLGIKTEHNVYTGFETLPTARLAWKPLDRQLLWGAVSRAVRAPARVDRDFYSPGRPPYFLLAGGPDFDSETANIAELGYRGEPTHSTTLAISGWYSRYDRLRAVELEASGPQFVNAISGPTAGVFFDLTQRVSATCRLSAGLVTMRKDLRVYDGVASPANLPQLGIDPGQWWNARAAFDLGSRSQLDLIVRRVGALPNGIPDYSTLDGHFAVRLPHAVELSISGQNLLGPKHVEWGSPAAAAAFGRTILGQVQWRL